MEYEIPAAQSISQHRRTDHACQCSDHGFGDGDKQRLYDSAFFKYILVVGQRKMTRNDKVNILDRIRSVVQGDRKHIHKRIQRHDQDDRKKQQKKIVEPCFM